MLDADMFQETTKSSTVKLVTMAYLNEQQASEESLPSDPPSVVPNPTLTALTWITRAISVVLVVAFLVAISVNLMNAGPAEKSRRTCGIDWILWMAGSEKTFQGTLLESMEKSREDLNRQREGSKFKLEPFQIKEFDINQLNLNPKFTPNRD